MARARTEGKGSENLNTNQAKSGKSEIKVRERRSMVRAPSAARNERGRGGDGAKAHRARQSAGAPATRAPRRALTKK